MTTTAFRKIGLAWLALVVAAFGASCTFAESDAESVFATEPIIATVNADPDAWAQLAIVDMDEFPWDTESERRFNNPSKTIFKGADVGQMVYSIFAPTFNTTIYRGAGMGAHYHPYWEWGYTLKGDSALTEPVSPNQKNGMYYRKREGGWLTRPPNSLHGGGWATGGKRPQLPYHLLLWEEGDGSVITVGPNADHYFPDWDRQPDPYLPDDWQSVKGWKRPWLVDSQQDLEWEDDSQVAGRLVKWLDDDMEFGFRSQLVKIPPGWTPPEGMKGSYFENANVMRYLIWGDMKVWLFDGPDDHDPQAVSLERQGRRRHNCRCSHYHDNRCYFI